ncbi:MULTISPECIES: hypothetical protein [Mycolicibacterium]|jgi:hypothetical protein|uniref:Pyridine nucleotide-disulfide oxidoreductase n=3 Tax=Mycolicibacterium TaxID=1866885 RepID=A0A378W8A7_9MYCO|nr:MULTISPECIES: hypothetical protein [Mycolicibacterium]KLI06957.1 pyridine nucleotide-disulfide oxidoreductase [Mycolicibacterium senegalense]KLO52475.1 pyridine nucleotide-disulfide oxidoreductase [Mycolicibacterium senegalense]KMV17841.1 pyridine nucleotide-disulfide oxidoreductase [Mycolicibacterium conceptionense]MCV7333522.1 hypothetical protein [Mycolicibacterium senegalense]MCW1824804.1 hypothetical protein [Mycolicibacterium senegalense]
MTISADDVRRLLASDVADAVLVLIQGHTEVVPAGELESDDYRGALRVASRSDLIKQAGGVQLSEKQMAEEAAKLDSEISNLGA